MDIGSIKAFIELSSGAIGLLKKARDLLPKGEEQDAIGVQISEAEKALKRSDVVLAQNLGYELCRCTFPPQIMDYDPHALLWQCPNCASFLQEVQ